MDTLIVGVGLIVVASGVILSWFGRAAMGVWATFVFGFLLVIIGTETFNDRNGSLDVSRP